MSISRQALIRLRYIVSDGVAVLLATLIFNIARYVIENQGVLRCTGWEYWYSSSG